MRRIYIESVDFRERIGSKKTTSAIKDMAEEKQPDTKEGEDGDKDEGEDQVKLEDEDSEEDSEDEEEDRSVPLVKCPGVAERLSTIFPDIKELEFPRHELSFADLAIFQSRLPQLEILRFDFKLGSLAKLQVDVESVSHYLQSPFRIVEANFLGFDDSCHICSITDVKYSEAATFVRYLFSLWPNAQIEALPDDDYSMDDYPKHMKAIALINEHLSALSCCNRDPSMKHEDVKILNEESWNNCAK
ncbi:hypothetical protein FRC07_001770 [Ceratobasidium sp. 392]|nr:hypothetical protein FRC07_001770 [Ceratobasidium sp. 392]